MTRSFLWLACFAVLGACAETGDVQPVAPQVQPAASTSTSVARLSPSLSNTSVGTALRTAILQGPTLRAARAGEARALSAVDGALGQRRPDFSVGLSADVRTTTGSQLSPVLNVRQLIYDGGASRNQILAAEARSRTAVAQTTLQVTDRSLEALSAWEELHLARQLEEIAREATLRYSEFEARVARRIEAGAGRNAEALRVASRRDEAAAELARASGRVESAASRVLEIYNTMPSVGPLPRAPAPSAGTKRNALIKSVDAELAAAEADLAASEASRVPAVYLDVFGDLDDFDDPGVGTGLRVDYDVGTNGQRAAAIQAATAAAEQLRAERELLLDSVVRSAADAQSRQLSLQRELDAATRSEAAARAALADAEQGFRGGRFDIFDLLDLGRDLDRAASRRIEVAAAFRLSGYARLAVSGELLDVFGIVPERVK
ncbi:MAG: TolC family protein [Pseudomonadota bacterium]